MSTRPKLTISDDDQRDRVRAHYGVIALGGGCGSAPSSAASTCCGATGGSSCCVESGPSSEFGYTKEELRSLPEGADLGLGCGNPTAILSLRKGQTVLDLGSGAGIDCFLAAKRVGLKGSVIGVDMTPEMLAKARENARKAGLKNVEFRLGEIEHLPVADASVDVVISNCVINLAPDKGTVYREAYRALRPGGVLVVSDMIATRPISPAERADPLLWTSCLSGAIEASEVTSLLERAGFVKIRVEPRVPQRPSRSRKDRTTPAVVPADVRARKPGA